MKGSFLLLFAAFLCAARGSGQNRPAQPPGPDELIAHARQTYIQQGPKVALPEFEHALEMFRESKDRRREAITLGYMGNCYRRTGDLARALDHVQRAMAIKQELGDKLEMGRSHNQLGLIYWDRAEYGKAISHFQQAIALGHELNEHELEGQAHNNLGLVYDELGDYRQSQKQYEQALQIHGASDNQRGQGDTLANMGGVHLLLGEYRKALEYYQQALAIHERLGLKPTASIELGNMGICYTALGDSEKALSTFDRALRLAQEAGLEKEQADWHKGRGETLLRLGKFGPAIQEYEKAQKVYEHAELKRELVEALNDTGNLYVMLGDTSAGEQDFRHALEIAQAIGNERGIMTNLLSLGNVEWRRKRYPQAEGLYEAALNRARKAGDQDSAAQALMELALEHGRGGKLVEAQAEAKEALAAAQGSAIPPREAWAHYALAETRRMGQESEAALGEYTAASEIEKMVRDPDLDWQIAYGRGQCLEKLGRLHEALAAYKQAVTIIEGVRGQLAEDRFRAGYVEDKYQVYVALVELLLKLQQTGEAFVYSERLRAQSFLDQLNRGMPGPQNAVQRQTETELRERIRQLRRLINAEWAQPANQRRGQALDTFSKDLAAAERAYQDLLDDLRRSDPTYVAWHALALPSAAQMQKLLPPNTALIEYVIAEDNLAIFVLTPEKIRATTVSVRAENLRSRVELLRDLIVGANGDSWRVPAAGLRRVLISPVEQQGWLAGVRRLYLVPNGVLNYLPFAALARTASEGSRFLGDDYALAYLPSAAVLTLHRGPTPKGDLLAMAPERAHLKYAADEVTDVGRLFPSKKLILTGKNATKDTFERSAGNYRFLHLATHGYLNRYAPLLSGLELEASGQDDGLLEVHEILGLHLHASLVTLSACDTALGSGYFSEIPAGDDFVGLTRAFLSAGSRTVLASLWEVNDKSTAQFMADFYRRLSGNSKAGSLSAAEQAMRSRGGHYDRPYYWAPFVLVGSMN